MSRLPCIGIWMGNDGKRRRETLALDPTHWNGIVTCDLLHSSKRLHTSHTSELKIPRGFLYLDCLSAARRSESPEWDDLISLVDGVCIITQSALPLEERRGPFSNFTRYTWQKSESPYRASSSHACYYRLPQVDAALRKK